MNNQGSSLGIIILTIILTALVVGGGIFLVQQNSVKDIPLDSTTDSSGEATVDEVVVDEEVNVEPEVEWLTYSDNDITFTYPKTFLGTPMQEDFDQNLAREQWEIIREEDTIYIKPNFESPAAEFGATYEIKILKDTWNAEKEWSIAAQLHQGPESQWGTKLVTKSTNYYVGVLRNLDFGLGQITDVYALVPGGIDNLGKSLKPTEKHFLIHAYPGLYSSYIEDILIPSIK